MAELTLRYQMEKEEIIYISCNVKDATTFEQFIIISIKCVDF